MNDINEQKVTELRKCESKHDWSKMTELSEKFLKEKPGNEDYLYYQMLAAASLGNVSETKRILMKIQTLKNHQNIEYCYNFLYGKALYVKSLKTNTLNVETRRLVQELLYDNVLCKLDKTVKLSDCDNNDPKLLEYFYYGEALYLYASDDLFEKSFDERLKILELCFICYSGDCPQLLDAEILFAEILSLYVNSNSYNGGSKYFKRM